MLYEYYWKVNIYFVSIISLAFLIIPMMASFVLTILYRENPVYPFEWLVYAYALFATIKIVVAIGTRIKSNETKRKYVLSYISIITALYTIQMLEFRLIRFVEMDEVSDSMYLMQLFTQGAIFIFLIIVLVIFICKLIKDKKLVK